MQLGIILSPKEESFQYAAKKGLDFLEFCINADDDGVAFHAAIPQLKQWMREYGVKVGSIGRWKTTFLDKDGHMVKKEMEIAQRLMDAAAQLGCPNYVTGANYNENLSLFSNCSAAIDWFSYLLETRPQGVEVSSYNCRKTNFVCEPKIWELVHGHLSELGIKYDPSHSRYAGGDYLKELADWGSRVRHVHLKGSMIVAGQRVDDPPAGLDQTDWSQVLNLLRAAGYDGGLSIEPHSPVWSGELGEQGVDYTIRYMNGLLFRKEA